VGETIKLALNTVQAEAQGSSALVDCMSRHMDRDSRPMYQRPKVLEPVKKRFEGGWLKPKLNHYRHRRDIGAVAA